MVKKFVICLVILSSIVGATAAYSQVPDTSKFWAWFENFFSEYRPYPARLQAEGTHCAVYTTIDTVTVLDMGMNPATGAIFALCAWEEPQEGRLRYAVYKSEDGGESWTATTAVDALTTSIASHATSATKGIIVVTAPGVGVFWSLNDGGSWSQKNSKFVDLGADLNFNDVAIVPLTESPSYTIYAVSNEVFSKGHMPYHTWEPLDTLRTVFEEPLTCIAAFDNENIFVGNPTGIYKWDAATTAWIKKSDIGVNDLVFDPTDVNVIYAGTNSGVYKSTDNGGSWTQTNLTESITSISVDYTNSSIIYAGTPGNGVYKSSDGGSSWTQLTSGLDLATSEYPTYPSYALNVLSVLSVNPDTAIAGTKNGVFRMVGTGSWEWKNTGILAAPVTDSVVNEVINTFENTTPGTPTKGIYSLCTDVFGSPPDIDGNGKIYILLVHPAPRKWESKDEDSTAAHTNVADILYLDRSNPLSTDELALLTRGFARMLQYNADADEATWLARSGEMFARYLFLVGEGNVDTTPVVFPQNTGLVGANANLCYLWIMYLYEKYGGINAIKSLVADTLNGFESIDSTLGVDHTNVFKDFVVACYLDNPDYQDKYGFRKLDVSMEEPSPKLPIEVKSAAYWGASVYPITRDIPDLGNIVFFNADNTNSYSLQWVKISGTSITVGEEALDAYNEVKINVSDITGDAKLALLPAVIGVTTTTAGYVINNDLTAPTFVKAGLFQNPMESRYLQTFVFANERLYKEVFTENPTVSVILTTHLTDTVLTDTFDVPQEIFDEPETDSILVIYNGLYELTDTGTAIIETRAEDYWGNDVLISKEVAIEKVSSATGGRIASVDKQLKVLIPAHSLSSDTYFIIYAIDSDDCIAIPKPINRTPIGTAYKVGPGGLTLNKEAMLIMHYDEVTEAPLAIYRLEDNNWTYVGGEVDVSNKTVSTTISKFGIYQIQAGSYEGITSQLPKSYALYKSAPNPANTDVSIMYAIPKGTTVSIKVYNISGQVIKTIVQGYQEAGYRSITWKLDDNSGNTVTSGVYFVSMKAGNFTATRKLVVLK